MGYSQSGTFSRAKMRFIERVFPDASESQMETLEILMDVDQLTTLLSSMDDARQGQLVSMDDAFGDLS